MKNHNLTITFLIVLLLSSSFLGCESKPSPECVEMKAAQEQLTANIEMYSSTWDAIINQGKIDLIKEENFTADITLVSSPENIVGIDAFKAYYNNYITGFSNVSFTIEDIFGQGDKIVKHWRFKGTHTGEFFGIPPTGREVDVDGVTLVRMKDGRIAQEQDFMDNYVFLIQLGLIAEE